MSAELQKTILFTIFIFALLNIAITVSLYALTQFMHLQIKRITKRVNLVARETLKLDRNSVRLNEEIRDKRKRCQDIQAKLAEHQPIKIQFIHRVSGSSKGRMEIIYKVHRQAKSRVEIFKNSFVRFTPKIWEYDNLVFCTTTGQDTAIRLIESLFPTALFKYTLSEVRGS